MIFKSKFIILTMICIAISHVTYSEETIESIREKVIDKTSSKQVETPIAHYQRKDGKKVILIGTLPLGTEAYYEQIKKVGEPNQALLFECLAPQKYKDWWTLIRKAKLGNELSTQERYRLNKLRELESPEKLHYESEGLFTADEMVLLANRTKLKKQSKTFDYCKENMIWADLPWRVYLKDKRQQKVLNLPSWLQTKITPLLTKSPKIRSNNVALWVLCSLRESDNLRQFLFNKYQDQITKLRDPQSIQEIHEASIQKNREAVALKALDDCLLEPWINKLGMLYGVGFINGLHQGLLSRGFQLKKVEWVPAFDIKTPQKSLKADKPKN